MIGGVKEYYGKDYDKLKWIIENIEKIYRSYGYKGLENSTFESMDILTKKGGEEIKEQIFYFDRIGLRFDHTLPLIRFSMENKELPRPIKRYCIGKVYRNEEPQRMRYIEFIQADVDIVGTTSIYSTLEILEVISKALELLGLSYKIYKNDRRFLDKLTEDIDNDKKAFFFRTIDKLDRFGREWVKAQLNKLNIDKYFDILENISLEEVKNYSEEAYKALLAIPGRFKPTMVRGLDYYTGEIFEIVTDKANLSIAGGGRYGMFDELNNVGGSIGVSRIYDLLDYSLSKKELFIAWIDSYDYAKTIANSLRSLGWDVDMNTENRTLRKQLEYASKNYKYVVILGKNEEQKKLIKVKNLETSQQLELRADELSRLTELISL